MSEPSPTPAPPPPYPQADDVLVVGDRIRFALPALRSLLAECERDGAKHVVGVYDGCFRDTDGTVVVRFKDPRPPVIAPKKAGAGPLGPRPVA